MNQPMNKQFQPQLESLEDRTLLSAAASLTGDQRLMITSNNASDTVLVQYTSAGNIQVRDHANNVIKIRIGSGDLVNWVKPWVVPNGVLFIGNGGNDYFRNDTSLKTEAWGGTGSDTLIGGSGMDRLHGGNGNYADYLYGRNGVDYLWGDGGNDFLFGDEGNDYLWGGDGNDYLIGGSGYDVAWGEGDWDFFYYVEMQYQ